MEMKMQKVGFTGSKTILATPDDYKCFAHMHPQATSGNLKLAVEENGRYILKAGTVFPSDDANAKGLVLQDYDVTDGAKAIAVLYVGAVLKARLPKEPSEEAKKAMPRVTIVDKASTITL